MVAKSTVQCYPKSKGSGEKIHRRLTWADLDEDMPTVRVQRNNGHKNSKDEEIAADIYTNRGIEGAEAENDMCQR